MAELVVKKSIGILLISTWKYNKFIDSTISGIRKFFFTNSDVKIYLHTDSDDQHDADVVIKIEHKPWPLVTLNRYHLFCEHIEKYETDYIIYLDIDSKIVNVIDEEILHDFFVVEHSGWKGTRGTPDKNPKSTACIRGDESLIYICGGFLGGKKKIFFDAVKQMRDNIQKDLDNNIIALWHDESHLNRYVLDNKNSIKIIDHTYMYSCHTKFPSNSPKITPYPNHNKGFDKFENMINK